MSARPAKLLPPPDKLLMQTLARLHSRVAGLARGHEGILARVGCVDVSRNVILSARSTAYLPPLADSLYLLGVLSLTPRAAAVRGDESLLE